MEEMLELAVVIIAAAIGIASKANKKKKAQKPVKPATSAWDEMEESIEKRFDEFIEKHDGEPIIPYAPSQPAAAPQPAQAVQPVQPMPQVIIAQTVPELHVEGAPAEPVAPPVKKPRPRPRPKAEEPVQTVRHTQRSPLIPERINAGALRSAVVMSEVLGKPVSLRNTARR